MTYLDEREIQRAISTLKSPDELFEIRVIKGKYTLVGYFSSVSLMLDHLRSLDLEGCNVYIVLNELKPECGGRIARDKFVSGATSTSDADIASRKWLFVDVDPVRPKDTSSTDEQVKIARSMANKVYQFLKHNGFSEPICALSGNGCHLLFRVDMPNDQESERLTKQFLKTLDVLFSDEKVKIDTAVFNAARVCKLYGTLAQKGANIETQPHRMSRMLYAPKELMPTSPALLRKIANMMPQEPDRGSSYGGYNSEPFDLAAWLSKYGIGYREQGDSDGTKYILDHCPFNSEHKGKDAVIYRRRNGAIGFHCFHDSCADKHWRDVRLLFEPDAYDKRGDRQEQHRDWSMFVRKDEPAPEEDEDPITEDETKAPVFETPLYILRQPKKDITFIKTGFRGVDKKMRGLMKGQVSLVSGLRGCGKSTFLSQLSLNVISDGGKVALFSGELTDQNFLRWITLQCAGNRRNVKSKEYDNSYYTPNRYKEPIAEWLTGKVWLFNNEYGNDFEGVMKYFEHAITTLNLDLLLLDNLMAFDIRRLSPEKYAAQTEFVLSLTRMAKKHDVHILFVAHPRKAQSFLRLEDISGTNDLVNAVDNAFILHRNNNDFVARSKEYFHWKESNEIYKASNIIEIAKDRETGTQDEFVPLFYEQESKRMKNSPDEYVEYGWEKEKPSQASSDRRQPPSEPRTEPIAQKTAKSLADDGFLVYGSENEDEDDLMIPF